MKILDNCVVEIDMHGSGEGNRLLGNNTGKTHDPMVSFQRFKEGVVAFTRK